MPLLLKESLVSDPLKAISPLDGRYSKSTESLSDYFSEHALIRYRTKIELEYLISLSLEKGIEELNPFSKKDVFPADPSPDLLINLAAASELGLAKASCKAALLAPLNKLPNPSFDIPLNIELPNDGLAAEPKPPA